MSPDEEKVVKYALRIAIAEHCANNNVKIGARQLNMDMFSMEGMRHRLDAAENEDVHIEGLMSDLKNGASLLKNVVKQAATSLMNKIKGNKGAVAQAMPTEQMPTMPMDQVPMMPTEQAPVLPEATIPQMQVPDQAVPISERSARTSF